MPVLGISVAAAQPPRDGMVLHLDAAGIPEADVANDGKVARWPDLSGRGNHVEQPDSTLRPVRVPGALNGMPVLVFSGKEFLDGPAVLQEGDLTFTFAAVWRRENTVGSQVICEQGAGGPGRRASLLTVDDRYGFNGQNNDQHSLLPYRASYFTVSVLTLDESGFARLWHNDSQTGTGARGQIDGTLQNTGATRFRVGAKIEGGGERLNGRIAEVIVYDRVLEPAEIKELNRYLGAKWDLGQTDKDGRRRMATMPTEEMDRGPDYTSKVPRFVFGETLEEQEAQLTDNPLVLRFAESRRELAADRYRPLYHFVSPESGLNDPNGLCFWQGRWHLFYQGYPPEDPRQHWGHAVSDDLIHWRDLPYAIYPDPEERCFSGAALAEDDRVIAMYHGTKVGNMVAVSSDPLLLNWEKVSGQAVIPIRNRDGSRPPYRVFDPCIWKKGEHYYSLSAGTVPHEHSGRRLRADFLLRSRDLVEWEYLHPFVDGDVFGLPGDDGACPYFWPIGDKHVLLHVSHMSGGKYIIGDYDEEADKLKATGGGDFNFGSLGPGGVHAPSACPDGNGGVIAIFNMNPAKHTPGWDHIMGLPRRLTLLEHDELGQEPAGDIESLRSSHVALGPLGLPANQEVVLDGVSGDAMEIELAIDPKGAQMIEVNVLRSPGREEFTRIAFYSHRGYRDWQRYDGWNWKEVHASRASVITLDNSRSSALPDAPSRPPESAPFHVAPGESLRLRIFVDKSIVEVFANGRQCVAARVYPGREDSLGVSIRSQGQPAELLSLNAWQMRSIYEQEGPRD
jgi:beta-fructofuranosidase